MKTKVFLSILSGLMLVLVLAGFTRKNPELKGGVLTIRTSEGFNNFSENTLTIVDEDGNVEKMELKPIGYGNLTVNSLFINQQLNKVQTKGYRLITSTVVSVGERAVLTTYIFERL